MMTLRLRYHTLKLRALCWVLRRLRAGQRRPEGREWNTNKPLTWPRQSRYATRPGAKLGMWRKPSQND
jgi:hypothetical protein